MFTSRQRFLVAAGSTILLAITVVAFLLFDRNSYSASDTLRPFLILMVPVWLFALGIGRYLITGRRR
jgi:uncharacterized membrane protein YphA (DoxX/SURF4 family)